MVLALLLLAAARLPRLGAQETPSQGTLPKDLSELSLEELMEIEVTSVSRREEPLFEAAAAIYVLTAEDLRRSGATSVAEALRLVPGLQVARTNASQWAITARGFNGVFANMLLALIDGRSIYTPLFGGIYWDVQDVPLEDIDRIEIIRGPGATLWGANAVNGVINIRTKSAAQIQGWSVGAGGGTEELFMGNARYSGRIATGLHAKAWVQYHEHDDFIEPDGQDAADGWDLGHGGFGLDWALGATHLLSFQGEIYAGDMGNTMTLATPSPPFVATTESTTEVGGGHLLGRWVQAQSPRSRTTLQGTFDRTERRGPLLDEERNTLDFDFEHELGVASRQQLVWGLGYRLTRDDIGNNFVFSLEPPQRSDDLFSAFLQDEIALVPQRLRLTLGSKFEHNEYTGFEVQPSVRLLATPDSQLTAWGAVSRAVRTPTRVESDVRLVVGAFQDTTLHLIALTGNPELESDELLAWEAGFRLLPVPWFFLDTAAFYNDYDQLVTVEPESPRSEGTPPPAHVLHPLRFANLGSARTWGVEVVAHWQATERVRFHAGYTRLEVDIDRDPSSLDRSSDAAEANDPEHQFQVRLQLDLPQRLDLDAAVYYVSELPGVEALRLPAVPAYTRLDLRLEWRAAPQVQLCVTGQNLLEPQHPEFRGIITSSRATEVQRGVYAKASWRY